ncbi:hypothetical protein Pcinc_035690 [Petrolisthes cinctipes]|uniref:HTH psq-type domain-containing protein n=1 Tax=Petrolisthes cinctipes TaxID=88211 RepID=A0AAE1BX68_PETCI|nr:hypothetical protein Pcinc_035690 [Petrolisthes cinctipes]
MPRTYIKKQKLYTEASIQVAIEEVNSGASVRSTAKKYHMSASMLRQRCLHNKGVTELKSRGRKTLLSMHVENKLASYVKRMAELGFGPTKAEFQEIVYDYLEANELGHLFKEKPARCCLLQPTEKFEAAIKARGRPSTSATQPQKRHRISMHGAVLTDEKFLEQQKNKEKKRKKTQEAEESDSDVDDPPQVEAIYDSSGELSDVNDDNLVTLDKTVKAALGRKELQQELPKENEIKEGMYYAVMYVRPSTYYWGKILKVFRDDENREDNKVEVTSMKKAVPSSNPQELRWDWPQVDDIDIVEVSHLLVGPAKPVVEDKVRGKAQLYFREEQQAYFRFKNVLKFGFPSPKKGH